MPGVQVLTQHNDNARTGANLAESILTPDAVAAPGRFGKLFELPVEGHVYAQPLYVPNVAFPEGQRKCDLRRHHAQLGLRIRCRCSASFGADLEAEPWPVRVA